MRSPWRAGSAPPKTPAITKQCTHPTISILHHAYQAWGRRRHLAGPVMVMIGGALAWLVATELAIMSSGLIDISRGGASSNATVMMARDELASLGPDGVAATIALELITLLVGPWMFGRGIRLLNRRSNIQALGRPSDAV